MSLRLFLQVASMEARKNMSYRVDFWINAVVGFVVNLLVVWFLWKAIFAESGEAVIGGFTFEGMIYYYILVLLIGKVVRGNEFEAGLAEDIYQGSLTRYLVYPSSYFAFRYAQQLGAMVVGFAQLVVFGAIAPWVVALPDTMNVGAASIAMALGGILAAHFLNFTLIYPVHGVAFWADQVWSLNVVLRLVLMLFGGMLMPLTLYPSWAQDLLMLTPFPYLFYVPVRVLMGEVGVVEWLGGLAIVSLWAGVLGAIGRMVWGRGYRIYTGVGI